jgi:hypothetical protein
MFSQLLVGVDHTVKVKTKSLTMFTRFLQKTLTSVPEIVINPDTIVMVHLERFITAHEFEICIAARKFMNQRPDESILIFSFAHNFRFLENQQIKSNQS